MKRIFISLLLVMAIFCCGCHSLRKKFVRKKKYQKEAPVYVDFKEYSNELTPQAYRDYHLFVRGWIDELMQALRRGMSFKRQRRAIDEVIMNIEQMMAFYNQEGKDKIYPLYEDFLSVKEDVEKSPNMSDIKKSALIRRLAHFKRKFESEFNYGDAQDWIDLSGAGLD
ncbi:MAG: hypothetical protein JSV34_02675 [Candidatus Omnitrophota bacterium]|nr:MAG: hypothetical protein JSV34_02675 [Candidatus Omnitrophota bacterium]